jgi:hypothetical protein
MLSAPKTFSPKRRALTSILVLAAGITLYALPAHGGDPAPRSRQEAPHPGEKILLFTGQEDDLKTHWVRRRTEQPAAWKLVEGGAMRVGGGDIATRQKFGPMHLHVEFRTPEMPPNVKGQARGNSGVYIGGLYEVQVLDSFGIKKPGKGDCGAIYNQAAPLVNASKPPKEWQTYDIVFRPAQMDDKGIKVAKARVTVLLNGIVIQNNQEINGPTGGADGPEGLPGIIHLQDHGNPVEYRNIWVMPLPEKGSDKYDGE